MKECKCTLAQKVVGDGCSICNPQLMIEMLQEQIQELEATIEAQEIIIKDKSAIMEAMAQPKTCEGCEWYHKNTMDGCQSPYYNCARNTHLMDRYKPKAQP